MSLVIILSVILLLSTLNYSVLILFFHRGLKKLEKEKIKIEPAILRKVTVIISARDEEENIEICLRSLLNQDYPKDLYDIIVVNDQSTDRTALLVENFIEKHSFNCRLFSTIGAGGKKQAFQVGLRQAMGELILTTDADCIVPVRWINSMNRCFDETNAVFVAGPVMMFPCDTLFEKFQCLEFNALIASTAGSFGIRRPVMSNGANMGLLAEACKNEMVNTKTASGEDIFTMFFMKHKYGRDRLKFINTPDSVVFTKTQNNIHDFIRQRIRWTSKSTSYTDKDAIYTALSVMGINVMLIIAIVACFFPIDGNYLKIISTVTVVCLIIKTLVDYVLLLEYSRNFGQKNLVKYLPLAEIPVMVYTTLIGFIGIIFPFTWKGRKFRK